mmetsp:Transcript_19645/g.65373  ORF Transcript_19645/g.65373 Transcript_19645/m.65373 type:complete len:264 (+) Transcript_19645:793-1584(+)
MADAHRASSPPPERARPPAPRRAHQPPGHEREAVARELPQGVQGDHHGGDARDQPARRHRMQHDPGGPRQEAPRVQVQPLQVPARAAGQGRRCCQGVRGAAEGDREAAELHRQVRGQGLQGLVGAVEEEAAGEDGGHRCAGEPPDRTATQARPARASQVQDGDGGDEGCGDRLERGEASLPGPLAFHHPRHASRHPRPQRMRKEHAAVGASWPSAADQGFTNYHRWSQPGLVHTGPRTGAGPILYRLGCGDGDRARSRPEHQH